MTAITSELKIDPPKNTQPDTEKTVLEKTLNVQQVEFKSKQHETLKHNEELVQA